MLYHVDFQPVGRRGPRPADQTLLEAAQELGVDLIALCGGEGVCGRCKIQVLSGQVSPPSFDEQDTLTEDELKAGYRLACQTFPLGNLKIHVPADSLSTPQRLQVEGVSVSARAEPVVKAYDLALEPPSLTDLVADAERALEALARQHGVTCRHVDVEVLRDLSTQLRSVDWRPRVAVRGDEVIAVQPTGTRSLGLAVDMGTTKVAGYLVDLATGETLASQGIMNPQIAYGEDVVTRIGRTIRAPAEARRMQELAVGALNELAAGLCAEAGGQPGEIVDAVVVGNTAIHHLLLRLPAEQLALSPYVPAVRSALDLKARDTGLNIAPGAYMHLLPNIAGFVGADHVAMLLATEIWKSGGVVLALDIGTNTEICLSAGEQMVSTSCASGPAFEGAHIKHGMRAAPGAIERLRLAGDRVEYHTIGNAAPVGLCGSGILDALAELYRAGVVDNTGKMGEHARIRVQDKVREFVLADGAGRGGSADVTITQRDVREVQLAKGAIATGIAALLRETHRSADDIDQVIIAGAFGTYIDVSSAIAIGMLPALPLDRFSQVGNAAGTGARLALISGAKRAEAQALAARVGYLELGILPDFNQVFAKSINLGETKFEDR